jgi:hypothetical protein
MTKIETYRLIRYSVPAFALIALATVGLAAAPSVVGSWECVSMTPDGDDMHTTLTVTDLQGKRAGTLTGGEGDWKISNLKFDGKVFSFTATRDYDEYTVILNFDGYRMEGKWLGGGDAGKVTATRRKS